MRIAGKTLPLLVLLCAVAGAAAQQPGRGQRGIYLCMSPLSAYQFWQEVKSAQGMGVKLKAADFERIAKKQSDKNGVPTCFWQQSARELKPIYADAEGMMVLTDGRIKGWVTPQYYVYYINNPPPK